MLTAFTLTNFKSYHQEERLDFAPLTVLIGANASGKSNVIEALRLLSWLAKGQTLSNIRHTMNNDQQIIRGRVNELFYFQDKPFVLGAKVDHVYSKSLNVVIGLSEEKLQINQEYFEDYDKKKKELIPATFYKDMALFASIVFVENNDSIVSKQMIDALFGENAFSNFRGFQEGLSNILFLDPIPARMRMYSFPSDEMYEDGTNLSSALFNLCESGNEVEFGNHQENRKFILDIIQSLPEQEINDITFLHGPRGEVMLQLVETFGGVRKSYDASLLSDGTLRVLAIAAAMLSIPNRPQGGLVVIEELDNGIHPSRAHHILNKIRTIAKERNLTVLLSTHNPALLDALPDEAVPDVVFCYRDPVSGSSRLVRMQDIPDVPELLAQGTLGHLMTKGVLDRFVKSHPGPEERKQQAKDWLESLKNINIEKA